MQRAAKAMAQGDFSQRIEVQSEDEVGLLGQALNNLAQELQASMNTIVSEKEKLASVLDSMTDGVITFDAQGRVILSNPQAFRLLGKSIDSVFEGQLMETFNSVVSERKAQSCQFRAGDRVITVRMSPLQQASHKVRGVVAVFQETTKEYKLEEMRREFVANVSHELRTPLSLIRGYTEAIMDGFADDRAPRRRTHVTGTVA